MTHCGSRTKKTTWAGFTLIEVMASTAVLVVLLLLVLAATDGIRMQYQSAQGDLASFQAARLAFDRLSRLVPQATLATYYDYERDANNRPIRYRRGSELHFIVGPHHDVSSAFPAGTFGQAIAFQLPVGAVEDSSNRPLSNSLNAVGFFTVFGPDTESKLKLLPSATVLGFSAGAAEYRFRLVEWRQPAERTTIFETREGTGWLTNALNDSATQFGVIAENIVALAWLPKMPEAEDVSGTGLAPAMSYDSRENALRTLISASNSTRRFSTLHQLPPLIELVMVAIDEPTAQKWQAKFGTANPLATFYARPRFVNAAALNQDLSDLEGTIMALGGKFRVFRSVIGLRGAKWSMEP